MIYIFAAFDSFPDVAATRLRLHHSFLADRNHGTAQHKALAISSGPHRSTGAGGLWQDRGKRTADASSQGQCGRSHRTAPQRVGRIHRSPRSAGIGTDPPAGFRVHRQGELYRRGAGEEGRPAVPDRPAPLPGRSQTPRSPTAAGTLQPGPGQQRSPPWRALA